jgi:regulator of protease activity HflC (stomatin/prohibitin superfamily)
VIERFGKFHKILDPGLNFILPVIDSISYVHSTKEIAFPIKSQTAITKDNVQIQIDGFSLFFFNFSSGVVYIKIIDAKKASYEVENPFFAISNLAQTTMRAEIGKIILDKTFSERQALNANIVSSIEKVAANWGISIERYEIKDVKTTFFFKSF